MATCSMLVAKSGFKYLGVKGVNRRFLTERELAEYASLSMRTLQGWRLRAQGPPFRRFCGAVRYDITEFETWVKTRSGGGEQADVR